jgi:hypothetical protein
VAVDAKKVLQNIRDIRNTWIFRELEPISNRLNKGRSWLERIPFAQNETESLIETIQKVLGYLDYPENGVIKLTSWGKRATNGELLLVLEYIDSSHNMFKSSPRLLLLGGTDYYWVERKIGLQEIALRLFKSQDNWTEYLTQKV